jgi:hypothetical protein
MTDCMHALLSQLSSGKGKQAMALKLVLNSVSVHVTEPLVYNNSDLDIARCISPTPRSLICRAQYNIPSYLNDVAAF